jgi:uncharacterized protein (UPF0248 family)
MITIRDLLNRIRWDRDFGQARFEFGYYDRVEKKRVRVPLEKVSFSEGEHFFLEVIAPDGAVHSVPRHRVRAVWRDGSLIWRR